MPIITPSKLTRGYLLHFSYFSKIFSTYSPATPLDYWRLLKPRVMSLVVFTGLVGVLLAPGPLHPLMVLISIVCIAAGSGAAGALNMWYERDIDALMERTRMRPLPQEKMHPGEALSFGLLLAIGAVGVMLSVLNVLAALYLTFAIIFYVGIYTIWLKRRTPQNIVLGGAAGALPPVIGWASVMNETSSLPWILFGIIFLWTPPHFWSLALSRQDDYRKAKIPMLPLVSGVKATKNHILLYSFALVLVSLLPLCQGELGGFYGSVAGILGIIFLTLALKLKYNSKPHAGMTLFFFSILYLFLLFAAMIGDKALAKLVFLKSIL